MFRNPEVIARWVWVLLILNATIGLAQQSGGNPPSSNLDPSTESGPSSTTADSQTRRGRSLEERNRTRNSYVRLARAPNMFGDSLGINPVLSPRDPSGVTSPTIMLLLGGANFNIAENNKAVPMDRAYLLYNGYYNAVTLPSGGAASLQGYTVGLEKSFFDGLASVDIRMPFSSGSDFTSELLTTDSGQVGNLSTFLKLLFHQQANFAVSAGLGVGLPTGSDVLATTPLTQMRIRNEAVHLMPFAALTATPSDFWFVQSFISMDFAATGNPVTFDQQQAGTYTEQSILHIDGAVGRWLTEDLGRRYLRRIAGVMELHYATTVQNTDQVAVNAGIPSIFSVPSNRIDLLNLTSGLQFELTPKSNFRIGAVVPLRSYPDRVFSSELQLSLNRFF